MSCVPRPIAADREQQCAVYEFIEGDRIPPPDITSADIDYAVQFLVTLKLLTGTEGSRDLPAASEACFSAQAAVNNIELRLDRLFALPTDNAQRVALHQFLTADFKRSLGRIVEWCKTNLNKAGLSFTAELRDDERTLSPSDYGFHNAVRRREGQIVFLDFEYFGWDDPAKMVCDFLLHPAMDLPQDLKRRFASGVLGHFGDQACLDRRIDIVYPLFGLKWCLIFLNEFVPEQLARRRFASKAAIDAAGIQTAQLSKARSMLRRITDECGRFPYGS